MDSARHPQCLEAVAAGREGAQADRMVANGQIVRCSGRSAAPLRYRAAMVFAGAAPSPQPSPAGDADLTVLLERPA